MQDRSVSESSFSVPDDAVIQEHLRQVEAEEIVAEAGVRLH